MGPTLFDRFFPRPAGRIDRELPFCLMCLDALVFLDPASYAQTLQAIYGADSVEVIPSPAQFTPAVLVLRAGSRVIFAFEGTRGTFAWLNYVARAGVKPFGPAPGVCFAPFVDSVKKLAPLIQAKMQAGDRLQLTGHSLGAAVAGMANSEIARAGWWTNAAWLFACPRCGDAAYFAAAAGRSYTVNLPYDPVPLLPPDVVDLIGREPDRIRWAQVLEGFPGRWPIAGLRNIIATAQNLDYLPLLAAANLPLNESPHQTYQYIRACWEGLAGAVSPAADLLQVLCRNLGLFDPWPAGELERGRPWEASRESIPSVVVSAGELGAVEASDVGQGSPLNER